VRLSIRNEKNVAGSGRSLIIKIFLRIVSEVCCRSSKRLRVSETYSEYLDSVPNFKKETCRLAKGLRDTWWVGSVPV
jgi:hypothetical protein